MKREVGVVGTGLEELSLKRICARRVSVTTKKVISFLGKKMNPPQDNPGFATVFETSCRQHRHKL